jgi:hypothetical protein
VCGPKGRPIFKRPQFWSNRNGGELPIVPGAAPRRRQASQGSRNGSVQQDGSYPAQLFVIN